MGLITLQNVSAKGVAYIPPSLSASVGFTLRFINMSDVYCNRNDYWYDYQDLI